MELFKTYKLWDIEPVKAKGCKIWDKNGVEYTDLYGGHAVISIGHCHPVYCDMLTKKHNNIGFYSNAVQNSLQVELAKNLGEMSGYDNYSLFLCNSGAESNENAIKLASFQTGRAKLLVCSKSFHGRTSGAVAATDNPSIRAPFNQTDKVVFTPMNDIDALQTALKTKEYAAFLIEGIQGVAGIIEPTADFLKAAEKACAETGTLLILDEVQSGYGRTGKFFAHQHAGIKADIITTAKGMGNGFPIGGVLISDKINASYGMLGTTFGGNHLACTAALAVLKVVKEEGLIENAANIGKILMDNLKGNKAIKDLRGTGLMIGIEVTPEFETLRDTLLHQYHFFTGGAGRNVIRLLPPLSISQNEAESFLEAFKKATL